MSPDEPLAVQWPEDPQSWNLYSYARNNPLRYVDPSGRTCQTASDGTKYDDMDGKGCAAVDEENNKNRPSVTVTDDYFDAQAKLMALWRGVQMAEPGVNLAAAGTGVVMGGVFAGTA